jgi:hypothetical protein
MAVILDSKFATAEDTAEELGVPQSRLKWLVRLMHSDTASKRSGGKNNGRKDGTRMVTSTRKNARGKARKVKR